MTIATQSGTAWLSSVRVVERNIKLLNERNLSHEFYAFATIRDTPQRHYVVEVPNSASVLLVVR